MYEFINSNKEVDSIVNKTIVDEFDYVNKISFLYSAMKKYYPEVYQDNLNGLSDTFAKLLEVKEAYEKEMGASLNEPSYSVLDIGSFLDSVIGEDLEETLENVKELVDINLISLNNNFEVLAQEIEDMSYSEFMSEVYDVNRHVTHYIEDNILKTNRNRR